MTGRITAAMLALVTALLAVLAVPLGLLLAAQERTDFRDQTVATASSVANVAEEQIGDGVHGPALARAVREQAAAGARVAVYNASGRKVAGTPASPPASGSSGAGQLVVTVPIRPDSGTGSIGRVVLARPTGPVEHRVTVLWLLIASVAAAGLIAATLVSAGLARWASRPLAVLAAAAARLGDGALDTRAPRASGPPEIRSLASTFNAMANRIEFLVLDQKSMMAEVSHQVRTPLAALRLRLDMLAQDADQATAAELAGAQEEIARLARLVSGLLAVARAENVDIAPADVDVDGVLADRAAAWRPAAEDQGIVLLAEDDPSGATVRACAGHLEQALDNLLANALDALADGGNIRLAAEAGGQGTPPGMVTITVADDGRGLTGQQQLAAFRKFATGSPGGTGLGLAIVDRLISANGGTVALGDTPGGGLTVTISLPAAHRSYSQHAS
jgi:signal transduction histidine kinase